MILHLIILWRYGLVIPWHMPAAVYGKVRVGGRKLGSGAALGQCWKLRWMVALRVERWQR